ncbi:MAG: TatD family deoxyribonuclease [Proteobacteria bacterium]|nr:MAG: TatD family deoxyribonuclease [Pseudomonadota bacterium]
MLIDSHAHLDYEYEQSTPELLALAKAAGVDRVIAVAAAVDSLKRVRELSETYPNVFFTSGIHPHDSKDFTPEIFAEIRELAAHPRCVAVGELGLDYHYDLSDRPLQHDALKQQLAFSAELGKPVIVHTRDADADTVTFLTEHAAQFRARHGDKSPGVIHCFTGTAELAKACLALGYYISFSGIITFKTAGDLREVVRDIVPLEKILVETDSPFLAPIPFRGKKNMPAHTRVVAEKVAELKGLSLEAVAAATRANTELLFGLPSA